MAEAFDDPEEREHAAGGQHLGAQFGSGRERHRSLLLILTVYLLLSKRRAWVSASRWRVHHPARDLAERREPDVVVPAHVAEDLLVHRRDHRPSAEVTMQRHCKKARRLALAQIVERLLVDVPDVLRARTQRAVVGEVAARNLHDRTAFGLDHAGEIGVARVAMPEQLLGGEEFARVLGERGHRADPSHRALAGGALEDLERATDRRLLFVGRERGQELILQIAVAGDVMTLLHDRGDRLRVDFRAARIDAERAADAVALQQRQQAPDADLAAVAAPGDARVVDARLRRCLHAVGRRLALRPRLQHGVDGHRDAFAVRPGEGTSAHDATIPRQSPMCGVFHPVGIFHRSRTRRRQAGGRTSTDWPAPAQCRRMALTQ